MPDWWTLQKGCVSKRLTMTDMTELCFFCSARCRAGHAQDRRLGYWMVSSSQVESLPDNTLEASLSSMEASRFRCKNAYGPPLGNASILTSGEKRDMLETLKNLLFQTFFFDWDLIVFRKDQWPLTSFPSLSLCYDSSCQGSLPRSTSVKTMRHWDGIGYLKQQSWNSKSPRTCRSARLSLSNLSGIPVCSTSRKRVDKVWWDLQGNLPMVAI